MAVANSADDCYLKVKHAMIHAVMVSGAAALRVVLRAGPTHTLTSSRFVVPQFRATTLCPLAQSAKALPAWELARIFYVSLETWRLDSEWKPHGGLAATPQHECVCRVHSLVDSRPSFAAPTRREQVVHNQGHAVGSPRGDQRKLEELRLCHPLGASS